jgi:hypothetical protein
VVSISFLKSCVQFTTILLSKEHRGVTSVRPTAVRRNLRCLGSAALGRTGIRYLFAAVD